MSVFTDHFLNVPLFAGCFFHLLRDRAYLNLLRLAFFLQACQLGPQTLLLQSGLMTHAEMFDMKSYMCKKGKAKDKVQEGVKDGTLLLRIRPAKNIACEN